MQTSIEDTIDRVEQLYAAITGHRPPHVNGNTTRIPPETDPVRHVEDQLGKLVAAVEQRLAPGASTMPAWTPRAIAWQDEAGYELAIDVPGVPRERLDVRIEGHVLAVRGERPVPWGDGETRSPFACSFALPERAEPAQITARLDAGVLRLRIARRARTEGSSIPVQG